jgi:hypothetical protein
LDAQWGEERWLGGGSGCDEQHTEQHIDWGGARCRRKRNLGIANRNVRCGINGPKVFSWEAKQYMGRAME